jgi:hypothetical protein
LEEHAFIEKPFPQPMRKQPGLLLKAMMALALCPFVSASQPNSDRLYSLLSRCNIIIDRNGDSAKVDFEGKIWKASLKADPHSPGYTIVRAGERLLFRAAFDDEQPFILNDRYQQGCETAKLILIQNPDDDVAAAAFQKYLDDTQYILDDTAAVLEKARFMNRHGWNAHSVTLLKTFIEKHPQVVEAYRSLSEAYAGLEMGKSDSDAANEEYRRRYLKRYGQEAPGNPHK